MAEQTLDLSKLSDTELEGLAPKIEKELARRRETRKKEALEQMRRIAENVGMTPEEILGLGSPGGGGRRRRGGRRGQITWRHPDDETKVYKGGKKPEWLHELEAEGRKAVKVET